MVTRLQRLDFWLWAVAPALVHCSSRAGGTKAVSLRNQRFSEYALIRPKDKFWPIKAYRDKFGDPQSARNRKLNHRACTMSGHVGVLVPSDEADGPWDVEHREGMRNLLDREEDVGSSGGEDLRARNCTGNQHVPNVGPALIFWKQKHDFSILGATRISRFEPHVCLALLGLRRCGSVWPEKEISRAAH